MQTKRIISLLLVLASVAFLCCCAGDIEQGESSADLSESAISSEDAEASGIKTDSNGHALLAVPTNEYEGTPTTRFCGDSVFVCYTVSGLDSASLTVASYAMASAEKLAVLELKEGQWYTEVCNGSLYVYNGETKAMSVYSDTLKLVKEYTFGGNDGFVVSGNGAYVLFPGYQPRLYSVSDGTEKPLDAENILSATPYGNGFVIENGDSELYALDADTCALTYCGNRKKVRPVDTYLVEEWDDGIIYNAIGTDKRYVLSQIDPAEYTVRAADGVLATLADGTYRLYDLSKHAYTEVQTGGEGYGCALYNGCFFVGCADGIHVKDLSKCAFTPCTIKEADESTDIHGWYKPYEGDGEEVVIAKRILEKYGVRVIYESERLKDGVFEYSYNSPESEDLLPVVTALEGFLQTLPDGMVSELTDSGELWFYPCRSITKSDKTLGGFAGTIIETPLVVVDAEYRGEVLISTIAHEFAHIFNYKLTVSALDRWAELTPFEYYGEDTVQYTPYGANKNEVWFISAYARTNEEEDRAETFAAMYTYANYGRLTDVFEYENVLSKARLYAELLRECFSSCQNAEKLYWEKLFE